MPIVYIPENSHYDPLSHDPYLSFNKQFCDMAGRLDSSSIKIHISDKKNGLKDGFSLDQDYFNDVNLKFLFSYMPNECKDQKDVLVHHELSYGFDPDFLESVMDTSEDISDRADYFYIPEVKHLEMTSRMTSKHVFLTVNALSTEENVQMVCNQLLSHDIAFFARGW